jgi:hypothetical protein
MMTNSVISYLIEKENGTMSVLQYNRKTKKWTLGNNLFRDGENFLCSFVYQNSFYTFNYDNKADQIITYKAEISGPVLFKNYNLGDFKLGENNLSYFLKRKKKAIKVITTESPNELFSSIKPKKAYQFNEQIYLSIEDSITGSTGVINFNLKTKKHNLAYFPARNSKCTSKLFHRSAISKNHFMKFSGCLSDATITIWDLKTNKIIKEAYLNQDSLIKIKNYDNLISPKQALSIEKLKSKVLLQHFVKGDASIYLTETKNNLELLVGYSIVKKKKIKQPNGNKKKGAGAGNGSGGGKGTGGGKQKKLDRINKRKIKGNGLSKSYLNYEKSRPQYFVCELNLSSKKFDTTIDYKNSFESIKTLKPSNIKSETNSQIVFKKDEVFWYGYIDRPTKKMYLIKIKN